MAWIILVATCQKIHSQITWSHHIILLVQCHQGLFCQSLDPWAIHCTPTMVLVVGEWDQLTRYMGGRRWLTGYPTGVSRLILPPSLAAVWTPECAPFVSHPRQSNRMGWDSLHSKTGSKCLSFFAHLHIVHLHLLHLHHQRLSRSGILVGYRKFCRRTFCT